MKELDNRELLEINGGGINIGIGIGLLIGAGLTFIIGVIDGYLRPLKCN